MPGYINGVVERKFGDEWELISRVEPFTGSQGNFKYVILGIKRFKYLDSVPHKKGFPENLSAATKAGMLSMPSTPPHLPKGKSLEKHFEDFVDDLGSTYSSKRYMDLANLSRYNWNEGISNENLEEMRNSVDELRREYLEIFKLVDSNGEKYSDWSGNDYWYFDDSLTDRKTPSIIKSPKIKSLVKGESLEFKGRTVRLEKKSRRELIPDEWFDLLDLLESVDDEVRIIFYWHH